MEEIFNREKAEKHVLNDLGLLKELLVFTLADVPVMLEKLESLLESDTEGAARMAHKIKGSAGAVSAERLFTAAFELEETAKEGDTARLKDLYLFTCSCFKEFSEDEEVRALAS
ncbi:MAG: Hpt domain-containing protein [Spirochaetales bacterium]|nr:Hpt domain-containing protein [Spirochaetales bacterium]